MSFDQWLNEAACTPLVGWDLSFLQGRCLETSPSWDFRSRIQALLPRASAMLDMGTGGGEFLQSLGSLPADTIATEGYEPNVTVASRNLRPLGIPVVDISTGPSLPFPDNRFDLVMNRHEAFEASDVARVLKSKGCFITQQVGGQDMIGLNQLIQDEVRLHSQIGTWPSSSLNLKLRVLILSIKWKNIQQLSSWIWARLYICSI